ncbi:hypothetical protein SLS62_009601 [Diatrype stigma]|uniref:Uncharacterized protein n=1 Tax=Diatrype stigma TaxID=117547 RepID=A0AAN9UFW6_9PEZI
MGSVATVGTLEDIHINLLTNGREYRLFGATSYTGAGQVVTKPSTTASKQAIAGITPRYNSARISMLQNPMSQKSTHQQPTPQKWVPQNSTPQKWIPQMSMSQKPTPQTSTTQKLTPNNAMRAVQTPARGAIKTQPGNRGLTSATPKAGAPKIQGADDWEIIFPKSINIITYIEPYKRPLEKLLGMHLVIKYERVPRLFIGNSLWQPEEAPDLLVRLANCERRVKAWEDLMEYTKECCVAKKCRDIMTFIVARKTRQVRANLQSVKELVGQTSKSGIAKVKTGVPPTPTGTYREYDARARAAAPQAGNPYDMTWGYQG